MVARRSLRGGGTFGPPAEQTPPSCPLCGRIVLSGPSADQHHLVPRSEGGRSTELVHKICHRKIHATFSEKELARQFHTWEALRAHPEIADFVHWIARRPPDFDDRSRWPRRRR